MLRTPALFVVVATLCLGACRPPELKPYLSRFDRPLHISHQGGEDIFPSNTLHAFRSAVDLYDTDVLELDVHRTSDGHLVVLHDDTVDRTTDGEGLVKEMTLEEIQSLDAAATFSPDEDGTFPFAGQGHVIPTLDEVFTEFPDMLTNVEVKQLDPPIEDELVELIADHGMEQLVCLGSFHDAAAARLRELLPDACHYAPEDMARDYYIGTRVFWTGFAPPPVDAMALPVTSGDIEVIDPRMIEALHLEGKHLWAWTINDAPEMRRLFELGVDGIMTDRPDLLYDVMEELGLR
jgi:glycerophosphoryl diester phosphodiesterase